jgi:hypothetical protein
MTLAAGESRAQLLDTVPPPCPTSKGLYFKNNPASLECIPGAAAASIGRRAAGRNRAGRRAGLRRKLANGHGEQRRHLGTEQSGLLLTDGTVIFNDSGTQYWWKLTPDSAGNYADGTWTQIASLPVIGGVQYAPLYFASAVLPDGRFIIMGGEYQDFVPTWTNLGAIYDPVADSLDCRQCTDGLGLLQRRRRDRRLRKRGAGRRHLDAGRMLQLPGSGSAAGCLDLTWTFTGAPNAAGAYQDEQGYELLPNGNVLTIDIWTNYPNGGATNAEQYVPSSGVWVSAGNTPVSLVDPATCGTLGNWTRSHAPQWNAGCLRGQHRLQGCVKGTPRRFTIQARVPGARAKMYRCLRHRPGRQPAISPMLRGR